MEIKGNMRQYKYPEESKEIQQFSHMNKHNMPNSKRTLIPAYQPVNNKENINHKAFSYYSKKFNSNSVGDDFIPNEESPIKMKRKTAGQILEESSQPKKIRELKPNIYHQKYVESSQIDNIPGPKIVKRIEDSQNKANKNIIKRINNEKNPQQRRKNSYICRNNDIESFQRKVFRDYNSNIACLPGVTINENEKYKTLVATNSRKNESHIMLGCEDDKLNKNEHKYEYKKNMNKKNNGIQKMNSFSGRKIVRNQNFGKANMTHYDYSYKIPNQRNNYNKNLDNFNNTRLKVDRNKSQIIFG